MRKYSFFLYFLAFCFFVESSPGKEQKTKTEPVNYPNPGIIVKRNGQWMGSDYLYNLSSQIPVFAEIIAPTGESVPITESEVQARVMDIFRKANIDPLIPTQESQAAPAIPFFHVLLMIYPFKNGYVALCEGRLFERVSLDRVKFEKEQAIFQAITWESQNLILTPAEDFTNQLNQAIDQIAKAFIDRFQFYEEIRVQIKK